MRTKTESLTHNSLKLPTHTVVASRRSLSVPPASTSGSEAETVVEEAAVDVAELLSSPSSSSNCSGDNLRDQDNLEYVELLQLPPRMHWPLHCWTSLYPHSL